MDLGKRLKVTQVKTAVAAGTSDQTSAILDMSGFDGVLFLTSFGAITSTAVTSVKIQQDTAVGGGTMADLAGSGATVADTKSDTVVVHDLYRPGKRYVRVYVDRGTANAVINSIVALQYRGLNAPTTDDATTVVSKTTLISPAEGTA